MRTSVNQSRQRFADYETERSELRWLDVLIDGWRRDHDYVKRRLTGWSSIEQLRINYLLDYPDVVFKARASSMGEVIFKLDDEDEIIFRLSYDLSNAR